MAETKAERFRVLILDDYEGLAEGVSSFGELKTRAEVTVSRSKLATDNDLARALQGVHAVLLMRERTRFGERQLSMASELKLISQTGKVMPHLDVPAATRRGVAIAVTFNDSGISTVELTIALIFALLRRIPQIDRRMRHEAWPAIPGQLLEGKTLGLIGFGRIGKKVAAIGRVFNARVLANSRTLTEEKASEAGVIRASLQSLLAESDIVSIHVPLNSQTRGLLGERELSLMKPGALLVNTARGPIVSEAALIQALERGHLGGVGLDVYDEEPLPIDHPLRRFDNAVLLPHRGYATVEVLRERYERAIANILSFIEGKPANLVNPEALAQAK